MIKSEFLANFCSDKSYHEKFWKPFINGDYVVATDTHILVTVNKEEVESDDPLNVYEKDYVGNLSRKALELFHGATKRKDERTC